MVFRQPERLPMRSILHREIILGLLLTPCTLFGQSKVIRPLPETPAQLKDDTEIRFQQSDVELNIIYNKLLARLENEDDKEKLRAWERAWIACRDEEVEFEISLLPNSQDKLQAKLNYLDRITKEQCARLKYYLYNQLGK
jgi:uncharacterized protein YecT (DUF1311 family)